MASMPKEAAAVSAGVAEDEGAPETFEFEHKLFAASEGAHFRRSADDRKVPVFVMNLGDSDVSLPFDGIMREFEIEEDSPDGRMLELVIESLRFVKRIAPGDPVPKEIVSGEASWEITDEHKKAAYDRLTTQLAFWLSGDQLTITDREEMMQVANDPSIKKKVNDAFGEAAEYLGHSRDEKEIVIGLIERLADDLAGIEALRDAYNMVLMIEEKIQGMRGLFGKEMSLLEIADPVARLMSIVVEQFTDQFELIDAQTGEIMATLKNIDAQSKYIRDTRDSLHQDLMEWEDMFREWGPARVEKSARNANLLRETYRFLAPRYSKTQSWDLQTQAHNKTPPKKEMEW